MFYNFTRKQKRRIAPLLFVLLYIALSAFIDLASILAAENKWLAIWESLIHLMLLKAALSGVIVYLLVFMLNSSLDFESRRVGHGQHGSAAWLTADETKNVYSRIPYKHEKQPGILVGQNERGWLCDFSDHNMLLLAPPSGGKTTRIYIPSIYYNAQVNKNTNGIGASMLMVDIKGTLYNTCAPFLEDAGYRTVILNFRDIMRSQRFNLMYKVNAAIDRYKAAEDPAARALAYGEAERYAKVLSDSLFDATEASKSEASDFFNETAKGLITGIVLLVSEYAEAAERHIVSVFNMIIELNGVSAGSGRLPIGLAPQKSKLEDLLEKLGNKRIRYYTGAASGADVKTLMNVFSSALAKLTKFIDAELEQILVTHSPALNDIDFISQPTAIFIICPDENTTRHFFGSLFIRYFANDLIAQAENETNQGVLPRQVLFFIDEFGNLPPIRDVDTLFSAIRSRGVRIIISLQSYAQLHKNYSEKQAKIIEDTCQMLMNGFCAPSATETAKRISEALDKETVLSGSVQTGRGVQTTQSMVGKSLMSIGELITLPLGEFIVQKGGYKPLRSHLSGYYEYLKLPDRKPTTTETNRYIDVHVMTTDDLTARLGIDAEVEKEMEEFL